MSDRPSRALGNASDSEEVEAQVCDIVARFAPGYDATRFRQAFGVLRQSVGGELPGYAGLLTPYHSPVHTHEVVLCASRILHGMSLSGQQLDSESIDAALIGALMHDIGYLMKTSEAEGTGAQFTLTHVARSADFVRDELPRLMDMPDVLRDATIKVVQVTDHTKHPGWMRYDSTQQMFAAYATAAADLVGQMASGEYLERLLYLYIEFREAKLREFGSVHELLEKTFQFRNATQERIDGDLHGISSAVRRHFATTRGEDRDFYQESIERNLAYLSDVVRQSPEARLDRLKRGGIVDRVRGQIVADDDESVLG